MCQNSLARRGGMGFSNPMQGPDFTIELELMTRRGIRIAGVDEVGRGPLAGPVTAAAVILDPDALPEGLNDSKRMTAAQRRAVIMDRAEISIAHASVFEIDEINILRASHLAMQRAIAALDPAPDFVLIDGNLLPRGLRWPGRAVIGGDGLCLSIAAASIAAKLCRDALMVDLAQQHPGYGWETNAGYGTKSHREALQNLGPTPHHRRSFKPVHNILYQEVLVIP
jgi:ribonuclease HII